MRLSLAAEVNFAVMPNGSRIGRLCAWIPTPRERSRPAVVETRFLPAPLVRRVGAQQPGFAAGPLPFCAARQCSSALWLSLFAPARYSSGFRRSFFSISESHSFRPWGTNAFFRHSTLFHNIAPTAPAGGPLGFRTLAFTPPRFRLKSAIRSIEYFTFPKWAWGLLPPFQVRMNGLQGVRLRACSGAARSKPLGIPAGGFLAISCSGPTLIRKT